RPQAERAAVRAHHVGIMLQSGNLFAGLTVEENARLQTTLARRAEPEKLDALINLVGLEHRRTTRADRLSGGEAARAAMVVALVNEPDVVFADEPTGEVDAETEQRILDLLQVQRSRGTAVI